MIKKSLKIKNKLGLHARPAALFVQLTNKYQSNITVLKDGQKANGKSIMGLMMLAAGRGAVLDIVIEGPDENVVMVELEGLIERKFEED